MAADCGPSSACSDAFYRHLSALGSEYDKMLQENSQLRKDLKGSEKKFKVEQVEASEAKEPAEDIKQKEGLRSLAQERGMVKE